MLSVFEGFWCSRWICLNVVCWDVKIKVISDVKFNDSFVYNIYFYFSNCRMKECKKIFWKLLDNIWFFLWLLDNVKNSLVLFYGIWIFYFFVELYISEGICRLVLRL